MVNKGKVLDWVDENVDIERLESNIKITIDEYKDVIEEVDGNKEYFIETLVSSHLGRYITQELADMFGIEYDDYEEDFDWLVDEVDRLADEISEEINDRLDLEGRVYLGYSESGSYGIHYIEYMN